MKTLQIFLLLLPVAVFAEEPPRWFTNRGLVFPSSEYITGVGEGVNAEEAQNRALSQIALFFQTQVDDTRQLLYRYNEVMSGAVSENTGISQNTVLRSEAEFFGVQFAQNYTDSRRRIHALAYIEREETLRVYDARIQKNLTFANNILRRYETATDTEPLTRAKKLREALTLTEMAQTEADMALLVNSAAGARYASISILAARINAALDAKQQISASIHFEGERLSGGQRNSLTSALQRALAANNIPVSIARQNIDTTYAFILTLSIRKTSVYGTELFNCTLDIDFSRDGMDINSKQYKVTEMDMELAVQALVRSIGLDVNLEELTAQ